MYAVNVFQIFNIGIIHITDTAENIPYLAPERCHLKDFNFYDATGAATGNHNTTGQVTLTNNYLSVTSANPNELLSHSWYGLVVTILKN